MLLNCHISAYARCLAGKVRGLVQSNWGTSQGEDKLGARDKILNTPPLCPSYALVQATAGVGAIMMSNTLIE